MRSIVLSIADLCNNAWMRQTRLKSDSIRWGEWPRACLTLVSSKMLRHTLWNYRAYFQNSRIIGNITVPPPRFKSFWDALRLIFRVTDQFAQPVNDFSIYFNSLTPPSPNQMIDQLFVDKHKNGVTPNSICFYLRVAGWNEADDAQLLATNGVTLEIDAVDPVTQRAVYIPLRYRIAAADLATWIQPHRTTVVDVALQRVPSDNTFTIA